jgi:glycosyltransferase involved in cell wall biosynthesis
MEYSKITITIPVYNEEKSIYDQILKVIDYINHENLNIRITIVNNGSTDSTAEILETLKSKTMVTVINLSKKGVGLALRESWNNAGAGEIIGYMDLDLSTDISNLNKIVEIISNFDILTASRLESHSKVYNRKFTREVVSRTFNVLIKLIFKSNLNDHMCGFKFLKSDVYLRLKDEYEYSDNWFFLTELLIIAQKHKMSVNSLAVVWNDDPDSKVKVIPLTLSYIKSISRLRKYVKK